MLTPIETRSLPNGDPVRVKRDDLYRSPGGAPGGKARTCHAIATTATRGLVTAGSRSSPQVNIVARIGAAMGLPVRVHTPTGKPGPEVEQAVSYGAQRVEHFPGYNTVIVARAREDALQRDWTYVPFGMETPVAVEQTATQLVDLPDDVERIVVPVGSGMSLCGIVAGLRDAGRRVPITGVVVGADPAPRLDQYAPFWPDMVELVNADRAYHVPADVTVIDGLEVDPIYEAKCLPYLRRGDLFWVVGIRPSAV